MKQTLFRSWCLSAVFLLVSCSLPEPKTVTELTPPSAKKVPYSMTLHGDTRVDPYYWLRDDSRSDPEMLAYLAAENSYTKHKMQHTEALQESLYKEIAGRLVADDRTVPVRQGAFEYFRDYRQGGEYPIYSRRKVGEVAEEVLLDVNQLAAGNEYFQVGNWAVDESGTQLAYAADSVSRRIYTLYFKDLRTGEMLPDVLTGADTSIAWSTDGNSLFYVRKHPETLLPYQVYRHELGQPQSLDELVYEEQDYAFSTSVYKSRSKQFIVISSQSTDSSEIRLIPADKPGDAAKVILPREDKLEYRIRHVGDSLYIITNWQAPNFRVLRVADNQLGEKSLWQEVIAARKDVLLSDVEVFENHLVLEERFDGLPRIRVIDQRTGTERLITFPDETYTTWLHSNPEISSQQLRYGYGSLVRPNSVFEFDLVSGEQKLLKEDAVEGGFDHANYHSKRLKVEARDGTLVPVSLVYRKDSFVEKKAPIYIEAYGAYGYSSEPEFSPRRLSLLYRGIVYAIVHVRGGEEMGRDWYENGKLLSKRNTFWDFIDSTENLIALGYGHPDKVIAAGGSAGGLLMGVVANEAPELYLGIIAQVPFVDLVTTMLDESIPLTTGEFAEWGNPKNQDYYDYMLSYSPYDQIKAQNYPNLFVTTGLHDSQVQYYEPVKWVAKLREYKTDENLLLVDIDMTTGHGGASGRYARYKTDALEYAFILNILGAGE
jgi:oligopeptidase B